MPRTVSDLIAGRQAVTVSAGASVRETAHLMLDKKVGAVLVMDGGKLLGVFTERDALRFFVATRRNADLTNVSDVMTKDPITVPPDTLIDSARDLMCEKGFRHLPVVDAAGTCTGLLSVRDIPAEYRVMYERFREMNG